MDTATNHTQQVQGKKPSSSGGNDKTKTDIVTTATDGTTRQQLNMMPGGGNFLQLIPETRGGGNTSTDANAFLELIPEIRGGGNASQTDASATNRLIDRARRAGVVSRGEMDNQAVDLAEILRDCLCYTHMGTERHANHIKTIQDVLDDVSMLDAMAAFLAHILNPYYVRVDPNADLALRRNDLSGRLWQVMIDLRRRPLRPEEIAEMFGDLASSLGDQNQPGEEEQDGVDETI